MSPIREADSVRAVREGVDPISAKIPVAISTDVGETNRQMTINPIAEDDSSPWTPGSLISCLGFVSSGQRSNPGTVVTPEPSLEGTNSSSVSDQSHTTDLAGVLGQNVALEDTEAAPQLVLQQKKKPLSDDVLSQTAPKAHTQSTNPVIPKKLTFASPPSPPVTAHPEGTPAPNITAGSPILCKVNGIAALGTFASSPGPSRPFCTVLD